MENISTIRSHRMASICPPQATQTRLICRGRSETTDSIRCRYS